MHWTLRLLRYFGVSDNKVTLLKTTPGEKWISVPLDYRTYLTAWASFDHNSIVVSPINAQTRISFKMPCEENQNKIQIIEVPDTTLERGTFFLEETKLSEEEFAVISFPCLQEKEDYKKEKYPIWVFIDIVIRM